MRSLRAYRLVLTTTVAVFSVWQGAQAADLLLEPTPIEEQGQAFAAVSGINGKWELYGGVIGDDSDDSGYFRAAASLSLPVGQSFGLQGDISVGSSDAGTVWGGAIHAFTRDPSSYLLGITGGVVTSGDATLGAIGPEAELYLGDWSLEAWAGIAGLDYDDSSLDDKTGAFVMADLAYYPADNLRLNLGFRSVLGYEQGVLGAEYQLTDLGLPMSLAGEVRVGEDDTWIAQIGLKGYFGGDPGKSLIDRQRQDDPRNRPLDLFTAAGFQLFAPAAGPDDNESCGPGQHWDGERCVDNEPA